MTNGRLIDPFEFEDCRIAADALADVISKRDREYGTAFRIIANKMIDGAREQYDWRKFYTDIDNALQSVSLISSTLAVLNGFERLTGLS